MANIKSAKKRARQNTKRRAQNSSQRSMLRTAIKKVYRAIDAGDKTTAQAAYVAAMPIIDKMAKSGIIHRNKAARHKSRLNHNIKGMAA